MSCETDSNSLNKLSATGKTLIVSKLYNEPHFKRHELSLRPHDQDFKIKFLINKALLLE